MIFKVRKAFVTEVIMLEVMEAFLLLLVCVNYSDAWRFVIVIMFAKLCKRLLFERGKNDTKRSKRRVRG